nr:dioxygenase [Microbacterium bovistercoris]
MASANKKDARTQRERARAYRARQELNAQQERRRVRDNVIGAVAGTVLLLAIIGVQSAYYLAGPGMPAPAATPTPTATVSPAPSASVPPSPSPTPSD